MDPFWEHTVDYRAAAPWPPFPEHTSVYPRSGGRYGLSDDALQHYQYSYRVYDADRQLGPPGSPPARPASPEPPRRERTAKTVRKPAPPRCECGVAQPSFAAAGATALREARWCGKCPGKPADAVNVRAKRCHCGSGAPSFAPPGGAKPLWCSKCRPANSAEWVNVRMKRCSCGRVGSPSPPLNPHLPLRLEPSSRGHSIAHLARHAYTG